MIGQEITYHPGTYIEKELKEFYDGELIFESEYYENGDTKKQDQYVNNLLVKTEEYYENGVPKLKQTFDELGPLTHEEYYKNINTKHMVIIKYMLIAYRVVEKFQKLPYSLKYGWFDKYFNEAGKEIMMTNNLGNWAIREYNDEGYLTLYTDSKGNIKKYMKSKNNGLLYCSDEYNHLNNIITPVSPTINQ